MRVSAGRFDSLDFRDALGRFATGVTVVTTLDRWERPRGITVNSFTSVSLEPPLVLFCLERTAQSAEAFSAAGHFAVNVLRREQEPLSVRFAGTAPDKWEGIAYERWSSGVPILSGCLANLECAREAIYEGGDHIILLGRVLDLRCEREGEPLLYYRGGYRGLDGRPGAGRSRKSQLK